ncbi:MAG: gamma-glutamyl-gamma-aminobutyrate hydrolase family protein [Planctomycetota bacterium]
MPFATGSRPVIGITTSYEAKDERLILKYAYVQSVLKAGGLPLTLPPVPAALIDAQLDHVAGMVFIGGPDYCPARYRQKTGPKTEPIDPLRERYDFALFERARARRLPSLYVCGGLQLAAISFGCQLIQDIPSQWKRPRKHAKGVLHPVRIEPGSLLAQITRTKKLETNSYHHQAIDPATVPAGLQLTAHASDGVVEALEVEKGGPFDNGAFFLALQWHPERMHTRVQHLALFKRLVSAAKATRIEL